MVGLHEKHTIGVESSGCVLEYFSVVEMALHF